MGLPSAYGFLLTAYCLLLSAYRLLLTGSFDGLFTKCFQNES
jgi:hypothetical protein